MSKTLLMIVGIVAILMGVAGLIPSWTVATEPSWHAVLKIVIGLVAVYVSATDKKA